jgi:hypothetical protein
MKKVILTVVLTLSLVAVCLKFYTFLPSFLGLKENAGINIESTPEGAEVVIDGQVVGKTPYISDSLEAKEIKIKISKDTDSWDGKVTLIGHTITFINRDLVEGAGETLALKEGTGVTVLSSPGATVSMDGQVLGIVPGTFDVGNGEHLFIISKEGFLNRSIKATTPAGYNLKLSVDLAVEEKTEELPSPPPSIKMVEITSTPTGFLRVRDRASTGGREIGRVAPGDKLELIDEAGSWTKIKLPTGMEGFVSSQYVTEVK